MCSFAYLTLSLPWLMVITLMDSYGRVRGLLQKPDLPARSHYRWLLVGRQVGLDPGKENAAKV
jgi:hypothetical protein